MGCASSVDGSGSRRSSILKFDVERPSSSSKNQKSVVPPLPRIKRLSDMSMTSSKNVVSITEDDSVIKFRSALIIQKWYRRVCARMEAKRRVSWKIFTTLEYEHEVDQLKLYNFFSELINAMVEAEQQGNMEQLFSASRDFNELPERVRGVLKNTLSFESEPSEESVFLQTTDPEKVEINDNYDGPHITFPITQEQILSLVRRFNERKLLHAKYVLRILHKVRLVLKELPNISHISTSFSKQITVVGDLHGKFDDLYIILSKNGHPSLHNPYLFNGDIVDRGPQSIECLIIICSFILLNPNSVFVNRGNHEDHVLNLRYGFTKEIMYKYKNYAPKVTTLCDELFSWLPLASVIDEKIWVSHGGISNEIDLTVLGSLDRHKFASIIRPPVSSLFEDVFVNQNKQVLNLLWNDPQAKEGSKHNAHRGGGLCFGPDITAQFISRNKFTMIIRSHECKYEGYEFFHNDLGLTIFSASNYYDLGSNKGAYVKLIGDKLEPHIVQFLANSKVQRGTIKQRQSSLEQSATKSLREQLYAFKTELLEKFQEIDDEKTGELKMSDWCRVLEDTTNMHLPWRLLSKNIAEMSRDSPDKVNYESTFQDCSFGFGSDNVAAQDSGVVETLYRHRKILETLFRFMDRDNSGLVTMDEFEGACLILGRFTKHQALRDHARDLAASIDFNKDGNIDLNEFLEAFRLVDLHFDEVGQVPESDCGTVD